VERAQRQHLKEQVLPRIDAAKRQAERDFADKLRDITRALTTGLDNELSASAESIGSSMSRLQELRKRTADQRAARHRELVTARDRFTVLHIALDDVRKRTQTLAR
jgi:hypothetical protein